MNKMKDISTPITLLKSQHNNQKYINQDSAGAQRIQAHLYLCDG